ncbi:MAG: hypothetical protein RL338_612 [Chloroflexota bacterium]
MHGHPKLTSARPTGRAGRRAGSAGVAWTARRHAVSARRGGRRPSSVTVVAGPDPARVPFLARVVDEIGDRERVMILGSDEMRVELEREYVAVSHRPDRLLDVERAGPPAERELLERLERLAAG